VSDTVFRADGTPASGTVLISWPAFTTADAKPVAAGTKGIALASGGALAVDLVPNVGASPTRSYYQVVFQLDSVLRTEYWLVGATSPTTISAMRTIPATGSAAPLASKQYADNAVAVNKAYVDFGGGECRVGIVCVEERRRDERAADTAIGPFGNFARRHGALHRYGAPIRR
jgi:hypothetical protein